MAEDPPVFERIDPAARARLVDAYSAGARVVRVRRLRGGLGARTQLLHVQHADGRRENVVLRAYLPWRPSHLPERADREFRTIRLAREAGVPVPEPLFLDAEGAFLGEPSMLLSYLPGRPQFLSDGFPYWAQELATAMHRVHSVTPDQYDLSWLPRRGKDEIASEVRRLQEEGAGKADPLIRDALAVLEVSAERIDWWPSCLAHMDFWPGNTIWVRRKLTGIIDWSGARLTDPRQDVAQCAVDALWANGPSAATAVRDEYYRLRGTGPGDQWYFDLLIGLAMLRTIDISLRGYHDAGLTFVTRPETLSRTQAFIQEAMSEGVERALSP